MWKYENMMNVQIKALRLKWIADYYELMDLNIS